MDITWLGHAAFRIRGQGQVIYIDPVDMEYSGARAKHLFDALEPADIILLTHHHTDHCNPDSFKHMRTPATIVAGPRGCRDKVRGVVQEVEPGTILTLGGTPVHAVHAYNIVRQREPGVPFHPRGSGVGYIVTVDGHTVYHSGDTEPIPEMNEIHGVDVALLPVDGHFTMTPEEAFKCASMVQAKVVIPMHFFDTPMARLLTATGAPEGIQLQVLDVGETWTQV
jgi:L-ascorbate metabolism protein UlaG (beta-lactamase superfamily)